MVSPKSSTPESPTVPSPPGYHYDDNHWEPGMVGRVITHRCGGTTLVYIACGPPINLLHTLWTVPSISPLFPVPSTESDPHRRVWPLGS